MNDTLKPIAISPSCDASSVSRFFHNSNAVAPPIVGTARKKLNSAAVLRSTFNSIAAMIVAPDRETPGTIAMHCPMPTSSADRVGMASTEWISGTPAAFSIHRMAMPPTISATATVIGLSSMASKASMNSTPAIPAGTNPSTMLRRNAQAPASRRNSPAATSVKRRK